LKDAWRCNHRDAIEELITFHSGHTKSSWESERKMDALDIKKRFAEIAGGPPASFSELGAALASWIAQRAKTLEGEDIALLCRVGGMLHAAQAEQNWERSWE
jgi:hypothetical protein